MRTHFKSLPLLGLLLITACQPAATPIVEQPTAITSGSTITPPTMPPTVMSDLIVPPDPQAQKMIDLAKDHLARKLKIEAGQIFLFAVEPMQWPDAGLGCPRSGMTYAQVETPGYQILFNAAGQLATYHTDMESSVILCQLRPPDEIFLPP